MDTENLPVETKNLLEKQMKIETLGEEIVGT